VLITHIRSADGTTETSDSLIEAARSLREPGSQIWLDMEEPDEWTLALLGEAFSLHPLAIEDCLHGEQRPHVDPYEGYIFMVLYTAMLSEERNFIGSRELAIFCSSQFIITIHHEPMECLQAIHERCGRDPENILGRGMDHLLHMIADTLMDDYQPLLDRLESEASQLEDEALFDPQDDILERISNIRTELLQARRYLTPQREVLGQLARGEYTVIGNNIRPYFRDVLDHLVRITEDIDLYREQVASARELFMSSMSQRSNDSIKIFTVIATLMMPPTLVASVYGMNFKLWPSGEFDHSFWIVVGFMVLITGALAWCFRRWGWF